MQAIVLSRRDIREADQIISVYTRESGKREMLARGVKKITSKNSAYLEPCSVVDVAVASGKELEYVTSVYPIDYYPGIRSDLRKSRVAQFVMQICHRLLRVHEADEQMYHLLRNWLRYLEDTSDVSLTDVDFFFLRLLRLLGMEPQLSLKGKKEMYYFSFFQGMCVDRHDKQDDIHVLSFNAASVLEHFLSSSTRPTVVEPETCRGVHSFVHALIQYNTEQHIPDWEGLFREFSAEQGSSIHTIDR
jgi:DNA repair protein RecO